MVEVNNQSSTRCFRADEVCDQWPLLKEVSGDACGLGWYKFSNTRFQDGV